MPKNLRPRSTQPITLRWLTVRDVGDVTPSLRRLVVGGEQMHAFTSDGWSLPEFRSDGFDDEFKLFIPDPVTGDHIAPRQLERHLDWPDDERLTFRTYTVRRHVPGADEFTLEIARHDGGVVSDWSGAVRVGDRVAIAGPKQSWLQPVGADWLLVGGDLTALPSIARWLEELPEDARGQVFVHVPTDADRQSLKCPAGVRLTWLVDPDPTAPVLDAAIRAADWWPGVCFAWVYAEATAVRPVRQFLRRERELPAEQVEVGGYWKAAPAATAQEGEDGPADAGGADLHELTDLVRPLAIRVTATLSLAELIAGGTSTTAALADRTGADPDALGRLLRYLSTVGVLSAVGDPLRPDSFSLTALGRELADPEEAAELSLDSDAGLLAALTSLLDRVRPQPAAAPEEPAPGDREAVARITAAADEMRCFAPSFGPEISLGHPVVAVGDGVLVLTETVLAGASGAEGGPEVVLVGDPREHAAQVSVLPGHLQDRVVAVAPDAPLAVPDSGTLLLAGVLAGCDDRAAATRLRDLVDRHGAGRRVVLVEELLDNDDLDDHVCAQDLLVLCRDGVGLRSAADVRAIIAASGLVLVDEPVIGWGERVFVLSAAVDT